MEEHPRTQGLDHDTFIDDLNRRSRVLHNQLGFHVQESLQGSSRGMPDIQIVHHLDQANVIRRLLGYAEVRYEA